MSRFRIQAIILAALIVAAILPAACGGGGEPAAAPTAAPAAPTAAAAAPTAAPAAPTAAPAAPTAAPAAAPGGEQPVYGGILMRGHSGDPKGFDPQNDTGIATVYMIAPSYENLIRFSPIDGMDVIEPELATSWDLSADGLILTFHLREGVKWSDGAPFTSTDVADWFDRFMNPPEGIRSRRSGPFTHITSVDTPDPLTVTFNMEYGTASTLPNFAGGHVYIGPPKHVVEEATKDDVFALKKNPENIIGTGPFLFDRYEEDVVFCSKKNPDHWREGRPYLDGMCHLFIKDSTTRFVALASGQIHLPMHGSRSLTAAQAQQAERDFPEKIILNRHRGPYWMGVRFNATKPPYDDVRVRKALKLAVDLDEFIDVVTGGTEFGVGDVSGYMPPGTFWSLPQEQLLGLPGYSNYKTKDERIAEAKALLAEAGYPNGFDHTWSVWDQTLRKNQAIFVADQWKKNLNINTRIDAMDSPVLAEKTLRGDFDVTQSGVAVNVIDPDSLLYNSYYSKSPGHNEFMATDPELDRLLDAQRRTFDPAERRKLTWEAERLIQTQLVPDFVLMWNVYIYGRSPKVGGFVGLDYMVYNQYRFEHVWLKE